MYINPHIYLFFVKIKFKMEFLDQRAHTFKASESCNQTLLSSYSACSMNMPVTFETLSYRLKKRKKGRREREGERERGGKDRETDRLEKDLGDGKASIMNHNAVLYLYIFGSSPAEDENDHSVVTRE